jgi:TonB family protein
MAMGQRVRRIVEALQPLIAGDEAPPVNDEVHAQRSVTPSALGTLAEGVSVGGSGQERRQIPQELNRKWRKRPVFCSVRCGRVSRTVRCAAAGIGTSLECLSWPPSTLLDGSTAEPPSLTGQGDHLVVRRGRLFTVRVRDASLEPVFDDRCLPPGIAKLTETAEQIARSGVYGLRFSLTARPLIHRTGVGSTSCVRTPRVRKGSDMFTNASAAAATRIQPLYLIIVIAVAIGIRPLYLLLAAGVVVLLTTAVLLRGNWSRIHRRGATRLEPAKTRALSGVLLSSRPERDLRGMVRWTIGSGVVHACVVVGLASAVPVSYDDAAGHNMDLVLDSEPVPTEHPMDVCQGHLMPPTPPIGAPDIAHPPAGVFISDLDWSAFGAERGEAEGGVSGRPVSDLAEAPTGTPYTVSPMLQNTVEVQRVLMRTYPPLLRAAGVGGTVLLWFLIDETGKVVKTRVKESSGHRSLDEAAAGVAKVMKFVPARHGPCNVPVWVTIPIVFTTR